MKLGKMKYRGLAVFDIDGVLADFEERFCESFGDGYRHIYSLEARYPSVDPQLVEEFVNNPENYRDLTPIFGGNLLLTQVKLRGYYIVLMTSRPRTLKNVTVDWLKIYNVHYNELVFSRNKVETLREFAAMNASLPLKLFVDDSVSTLERVKKEYPIGSVVCLAWGQPWNEGYYPRLRYNEEAMKVEANVGNGKWKWIWEK